MAQRMTPSRWLVATTSIIFLITASTICTTRAFVINRKSYTLKHVSKVPDEFNQARKPKATTNRMIHSRNYMTKSALKSAVEKDDNNNNNNDIEEYKFQDQSFLRRTKHWVVIVDDEESIRLAVGDYLYDRGYQVTACADADALLEVCATPQSDGELPSIPDCIVSDVRMPGKDGLELLNLLRADERLARVPVILLTAKSMTQDRIDGYKAGADAYLPKPFNPDELLSIIDNAILRRRQMTKSDAGKLVDLKMDMSNIKQILRKNGKGLVRATNVYLTPAEREVLDLLCKGFTNGEIAKERDVGVIGVNRTIQNLYLKTQTRTRTELVRWAIQTGHVAAR